MKYGRHGSGDTNRPTLAKKVVNLLSISYGTGEAQRLHFVIDSDSDWFSDCIHAGPELRINVERVVELVKYAA